MVMLNHLMQVWSSFRHLPKAMRYILPSQLVQYFIFNCFLLCTSRRHHSTFKCLKIWGGGGGWYVCVDVLELGVLGLVYDIVHISCNTSKEPLPDSPILWFVLSLPVLFHSLLCVCCCGVSDVRVISTGFCVLLPCQIWLVLVFFLSDNPHH